MTEEFRVLPSVLAASSPVFKIMLNSAMKEASGRIDIQDFRAETVEACLRFFYTGHLKVGLDVGLDVLRFADKYAAAELLQAVRRQIRRLPKSSLCLQQLMYVNTPVEDLRALGYSASELKALGYKCNDLVSAGFSVQGLRAAGFTLLDIGSAGFDAASLLKALVTKPELELMGFSTNQITAAAFASLAPRDLRRCGFSAKDARAAGFTLTDLYNAGYSNNDLIEAAVRVQDLLVLRPLCPPNLYKDANIPITSLLAAGFTLQDIVATGYTLCELAQSGCGAETFRNSGVQATTLREAGLPMLGHEVDNLTLRELLKSMPRSPPTLTDIAFSDARHHEPRVQAFLRSSTSEMHWEMSCPSQAVREAGHLTMVSRSLNAPFSVDVSVIIKIVKTTNSNAQKLRRYEAQQKAIRQLRQTLQHGGEQVVVGRT